MKLQFSQDTSVKSLLLAGLGAAAMAGVLGLATPPVTAATGTMGPETPNQRVTSALTRALRGRIASPGSRPTIIVRPTNRAAQGYFSEVVIAARPAQVKKLRFTEMNLRARNVRIDVPYLFST